MKKLKFFCISWISAHLAFLGSDFSVFLIISFSFLSFLCIFSFLFHFLSYLIIFFDFFMISCVLQHFRPKNEENVMNI